ncbi:MAG TPA: ABC-F family ATP-binding cassette domain-containing protein, partial [Polyangiaceae bacterium LLY-WYZ-14_1]|nr:ABC-F family ATP-binding cassette domain-containing protein [Polyangiaceae bacterium LLY-WYZ-14_1]
AAAGEAGGGAPPTDRGDADDAAGHLASLVAAQEEAAAALERLGGSDRMHQVDGVLDHLGIRDPAARVGPMSGGERRRVDLARVLVAAPDLAILDEPTNHLDAETVAWLETWLAESFPGALLLVTHDRYVLDRVAERTIELDQGAVYAYPGGWSTYLEAKAERLAQEARTEANRQRFVRGELDWLRRQPKARTGKQKARIQRAEAAMDERAPERRTVGGLSVQREDTGKTILELRRLELGIGDRTLLRGLDLHLVEGDRVGIVGPNGAGKTSLLRALLGELAPRGGELIRGKKTRFAFLEQTRGSLDPDASVFEAVGGGRKEVDVGGRTTDLHAWLERFLLAGPRAREKVGNLSGGERARVALARLLLEPANVLLLDEPTNDLDVDTLAAVETMILDSGVTALVVTHDRYFLDRVANRLLFFEGDGEVTVYAGGWTDALAQRREGRSRRPPGEASTPPAAAGGRRKGDDGARGGKTAGRGGRPPGRSRGGLTYAERLELDALPGRIEEAEAAVGHLEGRLSDPATYAEEAGAEVAELVAESERARASLAELYARWEALEEKKDASPG